MIEKKTFQNQIGHFSLAREKVCAIIWAPIRLLKSKQSLQRFVYLFYRLSMWLFLIELQPTIDSWV